MSRDLPPWQTDWEEKYREDWRAPARSNPVGSVEPRFRELLSRPFPLDWSDFKDLYEELIRRIDLGTGSPASGSWQHLFESQLLTADRPIRILFYWSGVAPSGYLMAIVSAVEPAFTDLRFADPNILRGLFLSLDRYPSRLSTVLKWFGLAILHGSNMELARDQYVALPSQVKLMFQYWNLRSAFIPRPLVGSTVMSTPEGNLDFDPETESISRLIGSKQSAYKVLDNTFACEEFWSSRSLEEACNHSLSHVQARGEVWGEANVEPLLIERVFAMCTNGGTPKNLQSVLSIAWHSQHVKAISRLSKEVLAVNGVTDEESFREKLDSIN
jgi:hypothetical protein